MQIADMPHQPPLNWKRFLWAIGLHAIVFVLLGPIVGAITEFTIRGGSQGFLAFLFVSWLAYMFGFWPALITGCLVPVMAGFVRSAALLTAMSAFLGVGATAATLMVAGLRFPVMYYTNRPNS